MKIVFATNNGHKLEEIRQILGEGIEVLSLADIGCHADIPETGTTLEENATQKARYVYDHYGLSVFADDTGLEVDALGGAPGVYSARYAGGAGHDSEANMAKLLAELGENNNRRARFRTVIALLETTGGSDGPRLTTFEGRVDGILLGGGMVHNEGLVADIRRRCEWIAPVTAYPGEFELEAMAAGARRVLSGEERPREYTGVPVFTGFGDYGPSVSLSPVRA